MKVRRLTAAGSMSFARPFARTALADGSGRKSHETTMGRWTKKEVKRPCVTQNEVSTVASFRTWRG